MNWKIVFTKQAQKDAKRISEAKLRTKVENLLKVLKEDPFQYSPPYEKLVGDLSGAYSRRINIKHRLIYQVIEEEKVVPMGIPCGIKIIRMCTHYE